MVRRGASLNVTKALRARFGVSNETVRQFLAEFLGTFILIMFGNGSVAQKVLSGDATNDFFSVVWGYALGVVLGVTIAGGVSGGHLNPAVTLAMALWGRLSWTKVPPYMVAQYLGAFVASVVVYCVYYSAIASFDPGLSLATAGIWATYPNGALVASNGTSVGPFLTSANGFADQVVGTMLLLVCVCAIVDERNVARVPSALVPLAVGSVVLAVGIGFGFNCGYAINPARDLAPRIFTLIAGWGNSTFNATTVDGVSWWWVPLVGPHVGAVLGVLVYTLLVEMHHAPTPEEKLAMATKESQNGGHPISLGIKEIKESR